ncbi:MAG: proton-conducting membrane transporter [Proteobacteria bacterium]|nr:proton-conducting membrane transporter [Pseudomonadota bacterium]
MNIDFPDLSYKIDELSIIMMALIGYIGTCVTVFASCYMKGDAKYYSFFLRIVSLICSVAIMVTRDNLWAFLISLCISNLILVSLMIHKSEWKAAKVSGVIAAKNYLLSSIFMTLAFGLFYFATGQISISSIANQSHNSIIIDLALLLLLMAAMAQSAIWPFHKWLLSSLNSPTPVSAIMHAGLINAGGFLLVRFAPLYWQNETIMNVIFILGITSALIGTLWKLMQSDVKRMLACSTMGQMGFMFAQCGLGLFPLAIAHLCWHGMFKAYLFLASGSAAQEKRLDLSYPPKPLTFVCALLSGTIGSLIFSYTTNKSWLAGDSTLVLMVIVLLSGSQLSLSMLSTLNFKSFILSGLMTITASIIYGGSTQFIMWTLEPMKLMYVQPLNIFHILGIFVLTFAWLCILFIRIPSKNMAKNSQWLLKAYVKSLNYSQPHQGTVTSCRNHYQY